MTLLKNHIIYTEILGFPKFPHLVLCSHCLRSVGHEAREPEADELGFSKGLDIGTSD